MIYKCPNCKLLHEAVEWNNSTEQKLQSLYGDDYSMKRIDDEPYPDTWFICPTCGKKINFSDIGKIGDCLSVIDHDPLKARL